MGKNSRIEFSIGVCESGGTVNLHASHTNLFFNQEISCLIAVDLWFRRPRLESGHKKKLPGGGSFLLSRERGFNYESEI